MLVAFENLSASAAIWRNLGLEYLLLDKDAPASIGVMARWAAPSSRPVPPPPDNRMPPPRPARPSQAQPRPQPAPEPKQQSRQTVWRAPSVEAWPREWREILPAVKPGRLAWTYFLLGQDMLSRDKADAAKNARRGLLAQVIKDFAWPAGAHAFVPCALPDANGVYRVNREVFWAMLKLLKCDGLVFLDHQSAKEVLNLPKPPLPFQIVSILDTHGIQTKIIQDMEELARNPEACSNTLKNLKNYFAALFRP